MLFYLLLLCFKYPYSLNPEGATQTAIMEDKRE